MSVKIQVKRALSSSWSSVNPILSVGEFGLETDTNKLKLGTGAAWNSTEYLSETIDISGLSDVVITDVQNGDFLRYSNSASAWVNDPVNLSTDTVGDYVQNLTAGTGVTLSNNSGEGSSPTIAIGQAVGTSSSVSFAHVTAPVTGNVTGNASTATALQTARVVQLTGDVSGSASFDGTANINLFTTVNTASVAIGELYGVNITSPEEFQTLEYNGTQWVNSYASVVSYVRNAEATTITAGTPVYLFGGNGDHASVKRADNSTDTTSSKTVGLAGANIAASENGPVITRGYVDGVDLSMYNPGDVLWLGKNGQFTTTKPSAPDHLVFIGVVVRATNNGIVYVATQNGYELEELHDVKISGVTDGQFLRYNSASTVWVNDTINLGTDTAGDYVQNLTAGTGVTLSNNAGEGSTPTVAIGQAVGTSASVTFAKVETTGDITVGGNLTVNGTTTTLNTETLAVEDNIVVLNAGATGSPSLNAGIEVERGNSTNVVLRWNESTDKWQTTEDGTNYYNIIDSYSIETRLNEFTWAQQVRLATYAALPNTPTYTAGSLDEDGGYGIGATLESSSNARLVVDGSQASNTNRILVKNQADAKQNGIYTVTAQGSVSSHWILTRVDDANGSHPNQLHYGEHVDCQEGDKNSNQQFVISSFGTGTNSAHIIGTDNINFVQVSGVYSFTAGDGLSVTDNTIGLATITQEDTSGSPSLTFISDIQRDEYGRILGVTTGDAQVTLGSNTTGNYVASLIPGTGVSIENNNGETATPTISIGQDVATSASVQFAKVTAPVTGNLTGNADTATTLETARTISISGDVSGSVSFDGSQNVGITATIQPNSVALGTDTSGDYVSSLVAGTGVSLTNNSGEGATPAVAIGQDVATSASVTFASVTAPVVGNASTASALQTARTIALTGDVSGSVSFDGSANAEITATIQPNSVALGTDTTGNYMSDLTQGTGVTITHSPGEGSNATIAIGQDVGTSASVQFAAVTAPVVGNATTASTLQTARTISLSGDVSGSVSFDGSGDASITATIEPNSVALGTDTTGNYMSGVSAGTGISVTHTPGEGSSASISLDATLDNLSDVTAPSPSSGDFLKWDGSAWVNDAVNLGTDTTGNYMSDLTQGTGVIITHTPSEGSNATIAIGQSVATTASVTFANVTADIVGNVTGNVTGSSGSTTGNAATATALQNARAISLTGDVSGSVSFDGTSNVSISSTIQPNSVALGTDTTGNYVNDITAGTGVTVTHTPGEGSSPTVAIGQAVGTSASVVFARLETTGSLFVGQNIYVSGSVVTENQVSLEIDDPFIYLNTSASTTGIDTGVIASYYDGSHVHAGYFRDATDGKFKFFDSYVPEPHTPIDTADVSYSPAPVVAEYFESIVANGTAPLSVSSSTVVANLNADKLDGQDGSYYAPINNPTFTGTVSLPNNTVALGTQTTGNYVSDVTGGTGVTVTHTPGEGSSPSIAIGQSVATSASVTFAAVTAPLTGNVTGDVSGNAGTVTNGVYTTSSINALADVDTVSASPSSGQFLKWNGTNWVPDSVPTINALDDIGNVIAPSPSDGQFLKYVSASTAWVPANVPTINALDDIGNVNAPTPSTGDFLKWDGSAWVSSAGGASTLDGLTDVTAPTPSTGDFLKWNGSAWINQSGVVTTGDTGTVTSAMIADSTIVNADISASAAIALSKLASGTSGQIIVANSSGVPTWVSETGDVTISDTGVTAIKSSVALSGAPTAATATSGTNTTQIATTAFTTTAVRDSLIRFYMEVM